MRTFPSLLTGLIAGFAFAGVLFAQSGGQNPGSAQGVTEPASAEEAVAAKAKKAIADFEGVKGVPKKRAQAGRLLKWLGEVDHASITEYLGEQIAAAGPTPGSIGYLQAIAHVPRPELLNDVWKLIHHDKAQLAVRRAAAAAVLSMGKRPTDRLLRMLRKGSESAKEPARLAAVSAIVASKDERAIRGIAPVFAQGTSADKVKYLRLLEPVQGVASISSLRVRLVTKGTLVLAAMAWRQLAVEGHPRARDLAIDVLERMPQGPTPTVAADMIIGIALVRDEDLYPLLLRYGASTNKAIKRALRAAAPHAAKDPALMEYMAKYGLEDSRSTARAAALMLLRQAPPGAVAPLVERVRKELRRPRKEALDLATGLHDLLAKDPTWRKDLLRLAESREPEVRTVGLSLLRELGCDEAIPHAQRSLTAKSWELRVACIRYLTSFRDVSSIPLLIARTNKEEGRLAAELANALFVHTGTRCFKKSEWASWWTSHKVGFALPHPDTVRAGLGGLAGQTSAYFGIPLVSKHVAFLIDVSGSMTARIGSGTDRKRRRIDAAKLELAKALKSIPREHRFNLIEYSGGVNPLWDELRRANDENRDEILDQVKKLRARGGTNIYGALEMAFRDSSVDTVYLLTDGEPSAGEIIVPDDIADEVQRWNRVRQIVIHTIGFGIDSALLKRLAEESGGVYKFVK